MDLNIKRDKQDILKWSFNTVITFRKLVAQKYIQFSEKEMDIVTKALEIINHPYKEAVAVTIDGVSLDVAKLDDLEMSANDVKIVTAYRAILMGKMMTLPPNTLRTMQILRELFGNY